MPAKKHKGAHLRRAIQSRFNFDMPGRTLSADGPREVKPSDLGGRDLDRPARGLKRLTVPLSFKGILAMSFLANAERRHREKKRREVRGQW